MSNDKKATLQQINYVKNLRKHLKKDNPTDAELSVMTHRQIVPIILKYKRLYKNTLKD